MVAAYLFDARYELKSDLYPANVCYNIALAFQRTAQTQHYAETSKDFTFQAKTTRPEKNREVYVMVSRRDIPCRVTVLVTVIPSIRYRNITK